MKVDCPGRYIYEEKETRRLLHQWAGSERKLVVGQFTFWRAGNRLQRSLGGLLRALVHYILEDLQHLTPLVFPQHCNTLSTLHWSNQLVLDIQPGEIREAFQYLTCARDELRNYCFCFFIDGLDEFQDSNPMENHRLLMKGLQSWTNLNPENLKLCVSGREEDPFMDLLSPNRG
jgi:hypothetical protein